MNNIKNRHLFLLDNHQGVNMKKNAQDKHYEALSNMTPEQSDIYIQQRLENDKLKKRNKRLLDIICKENENRQKVTRELETKTRETKREKLFIEIICYGALLYIVAQMWMR